MQKTMITQSPLDEDFRRYTSQLLSSAEKDIIIIAGEVGSFRFLDLRKKIEKPKWDEDPLWLMLQNPLDWSEETNSSKFDEKFPR